MRKFNNIVKESLITQDTIEDNLLSLKEDLGWVISTTSPGSIENHYSDGSLNYSYSPDWKINYPFHIVTLVKENFKLYSNDDIYEKTISQINSIKKRIPNIHFCFDADHSRGGLYQDNPLKLTLVLMIVDISNPIDSGKVEKLKHGGKIISEILNNKPYGISLKPYAALTWENDYVKCTISFDGSKVHASEHNHYITMCGILRDTIEEELHFVYKSKDSITVSKINTQENSRNVEVTFTIKAN